MAKAKQQFELSTLVQKKLRELDLTADEVIRKALNIKALGFDAGFGVVFPEGTRFLTWYKERPYWGIVREGTIVIEGQEYGSVSSAAEAVTGRHTQNGWDFWTIGLPGKNDFVPIMNFRKQTEP